MILKKTILSLLFTSFLFSNSDVPKLTQDMYYEKVEFVIAKSTTDYKEANKVAKKLSKKLDIELNLRGLTFNKESLLTFDEQTCEDNLMAHPCYMRRGRYDAGEYVSIEHTNAYSEFKDGYYIVVVASGQNLKKSLKKVKTQIKDAYVKSAKIYMGSTN